MQKYANHLFERNMEVAVQNREEEKIKKVIPPQKASQVKLKGGHRIVVDVPKNNGTKITMPVNKGMENVNIKPIGKPTPVVLQEEKNSTEEKEQKLEENKEKVIIEKSNEQKIKKQEEVKEKKIKNKEKKKIKIQTDFFKNLGAFLERPKIYKGTCIALVLLSLFLIVVAVFFIRQSIYKNGVPNIVTVVYNFEKISKVNHDGKYVFPNGEDQVYVNLSEIAGHISLMAIGDSSKMRFYKNDGTYLSVEDGSQYVMINGVEVYLPSVIVFNGKEVFVPVELLQYYTSGLNVEYNIHRERLTISFIQAKDSAGMPTSAYEEFMFLPNIPQAIDPIPEPQ